VPQTIAVITGGSVSSARPAFEGPLTSFLKRLPEGNYFCKPNRGCNGVGAFQLNVEGACIAIEGEPQDISAVAERLSKQDYVIQEGLAPKQHPDIARFKGGVINTLRLVTFATDEGAKPIAASLRMAIALNSIDSWTQGGVVAAIDLKEGVLKPYGVLKKGMKIVEAHPGSGLKFRDQRVPHLSEAIAMACSLHDKLDKTKSLGWDIALLKDGPCILECNRQWDILMSAQLNPDLPRDFLAFHLPRACDVAARVDISGEFTNRAQICQRLFKIAGLSVVSGRIEHLSRGRLCVLLGGAREAMQIAAEVFRRKALELGARTMKITRTADEPAPGFDITAAYRAAKVIESARPA
jgi:hypothetical protein